MAERCNWFPKRYTMLPDTQAVPLLFGMEDLIVAINMKRSRPVAEGDIAVFEQALEMKLPGQYREFLLQYNAAKPETNIFGIPGGSNQSGVNEFIPLERLLSESKNVDGVACRFVAVAWAEGGNYVCLDLDSGERCSFGITSNLLTGYG